jgi:hypothetical protein
MGLKLAKHYKAGATLISQLSDVSKFIETWNEERNTVVHGIYGMVPETREIYVEMHRGKHQGKRQPMNNKRVAAIINETEAILEPLQNTLIKLGYIEGLEQAP